MGEWRARARWWSRWKAERCVEGITPRWKNAFSCIIAVCKEVIRWTVCLRGGLCVHSSTPARLCPVWVAHLFMSEHPAQPVRPHPASRDWEGELSWPIRMALCTLHRRGGENKEICPNYVANVVRHAAILHSLQNSSRRTKQLEV